jgi:hypothetical protein
MQSLGPNAYRAEGDCLDNELLNPTVLKVRDLDDSIDKGIKDIRDANTV